MKKGFVKIVSGATVVVLLSMVLSGCSPKIVGDKTNGTEKTITFPLKEPVTLTYWTPFATSLLSALKVSSLGNTELYKELEKRTGVKIKFIHPLEGEEIEQFNLMVAAKDLPDIINANLDGLYSGGAAKAYNAGVIVDLKSLQQKYAPNLSKIYAAYPELLMDIESEDGKYYFVPFLHGDESLLVNSGIMLRKDWLDELGMQVPETIDEWYNILKSFKDRKGAKSPLITQSGYIDNLSLLGAFAVSGGYFIENGKVKFGFADTRYKEYIKIMSNWYKEGLLDNEYVTNNQKTIDAKVLSGQGGAFIGTIGGTLGRYMTLMKDKDPKFNLIAAPYATLKKGTPSIMMNISKVVDKSFCGYITTANKNPEISMAWLDYAYGREGHYLFNFGIEGVSYIMENGYPKYTELITKNPQGLPFTTIAQNYFKAATGGLFVQDKRYVEQYYALPEQKDALKTWSKYINEVNQANTVLRGNLTTEEYSKIASKQNKIDTYKTEKINKWITGAESLDSFDNYVEQLNKLGLADIIKIRQDAYDRFVNKFPQDGAGESININDRFYK